uniref:G_PROTEIN_RECEP_F3_4 domain-containing protein n=1 Tax=Macrostomum lignano TaxID=282301 RepID=A0A1I8F6W3_9PLAT
LAGFHGFADYGHPPAAIRAHPVNRLCCGSGSKRMCGCRYGNRSSLEDSEMTDFAELPTLHFVSDAGGISSSSTTALDGPPEYSIQYYSFQQARWTTGGTYVGTKAHKDRLTAEATTRSRVLSLPGVPLRRRLRPGRGETIPTAAAAAGCASKCARYDIVLQSQVSPMHSWLSRHSRASQVCSTCPEWQRSRTLLATLRAAAVDLERLQPFAHNSGSLSCPAWPHLAVCILIRVAPGLCFTVCHAAILAKTNRIARIFQVSSNSSKKTKFTSPISQLYIIGSMVIAELLILSCGRAHEQARAGVQRGERPPTLSASISFPIVLLLLATLYAFKIRKVPDGFNETRMVAFVKLCELRRDSFILIPVMFVLDKETGVVLCYGMQLSATAVLLGLFPAQGVHRAGQAREKTTKEAVMSRTRSLGTINSKYAQVETRKNSMDSIGCRRCLSAAGSVAQDVNNLEGNRGLDSVELHYSRRALHLHLRVHKNVSFSDVEIVRQRPTDDNAERFAGLATRAAEGGRLVAVAQDRWRVSGLKGGQQPLRKSGGHPPDLTTTVQPTRLSHPPCSHLHHHVPIAVQLFDIARAQSKLVLTFELRQNCAANADGCER